MELAPLDPKMTIQQWLEKNLTESGMSQFQAQSVFEQMQQSQNTELEGVKFGDKLNSYPKEFYAVLSLTLRAEALKWIETNAPQAWFKPMFMSKDEAEKLFDTLKNPNQKI